MNKLSIKNSTNQPAKSPHKQSKTNFKPQSKSIHTTKLRSTLISLSTQSSLLAPTSLSSLSSFSSLSSSLSSSSLSSSLSSLSLSSSLSSSLSPITTSQFASFHATTAPRALGGGRSKGTAPQKKAAPDGPVKVKKEASQDEKDKKKLEKLQREKAKAATRSAQLDRQTERNKKEQVLQQTKHQRLVQSLQSQRVTLLPVDPKEAAELEAYHKLLDQEEADAKTAKAAAIKAAANLSAV